LTLIQAPSNPNSSFAHQGDSFIRAQLCNLEVVLQNIKDDPEFSGVNQVTLSHAITQRIYQIPTDLKADPTLLLNLEGKEPAWVKVMLSYASNIGMYKRPKFLDSVIKDLCDKG
jgi:hypothetical protein